MRYKDDWEKAMRRFSAFWNREITDRCAIAVTARSKNARRYSLPEDSAPTERKWTDPAVIIPRLRRDLENTYFGGEAFPRFSVNLGTAGHAGFFRGEKHIFMEETVWFRPSVSSPTEIEFDENAYLYQKTLELARVMSEDSRGDYILSMPDDSGNIDALAHLMGSAAVMEHMIDDPDGIKQALKKIQSAYERITRECYAIAREVNYGGSHIGWLMTWAPGLHAQMQCDMSVMLSGQMFDEFILPELEAQTALLDYPLYHLDGFEQCRHLDSLLSLPRLKAIQWTQVSGQPDALRFIPELKRIQAAGKCLVIRVWPGQVEPLMRELSSRGLYLITETETEDEAKSLLRTAERQTHD